MTIPAFFSKANEVVVPRFEDKNRNNDAESAKNEFNKIFEFIKGADEGAVIRCRSKSPDQKVLYARNGSSLRQSFQKIFDWTSGAIKKRNDTRDVINSIIKSLDIDESEKIKLTNNITDIAETRDLRKSDLKNFLDAINKELNTEEIKGEEIELPPLDLSDEDDIDFDKNKILDDLKTNNVVNGIPEEPLAHGDTLADAALQQVDTEKTTTNSLSTREEKDFGGLIPIKEKQVDSKSELKIIIGTTTIPVSHYTSEVAQEECYLPQNEFDKSAAIPKKENDETHRNFDLENKKVDDKTPVTNSVDAVLQPVEKSAKIDNSLPIPEEEDFVGLIPIKDKEVTSHRKLNTIRADAYLFPEGTRFAQFEGEEKSSLNNEKSKLGIILFEQTSNNITRDFLKVHLETPAIEDGVYVGLLDGEKATQYLNALKDIYLKSFMRVVDEFSQNGKLTSTVSIALVPISKTPILTGLEAKALAEAVRKFKEENPMVLIQIVTDATRKKILVEEALKNQKTPSSV